MSTEPLESRLVGVIRWVVGLVLMFAAVSKASNVPLFAASFYPSISGVVSLSSGQLLVLGFGIIWIEMFVGVSLLTNNAPLLMRVSTLVLIVIFTIILVRMAVSGKADSCGCFGILPPGLDGLSGLRVSIVRNLLLILAIGYSVYALLEKQHQVDQAESCM